MRKLVALLAAGVLMAGTATLVIWLQLRVERERGAELAAQSATPEIREMAEVVVPPLQPPAETRAVQVASSSAAAPAAPPSPPPSSASATALPQEAAPAPAAGPADPVSGMMKVMMRQMYPDLAIELDLDPAT